MPTRFLLLRHAESTHPHVFNGGETDVPLSPRGERQALAIAPVLATFTPHVVVSSAMRRAVQTARPIAEACAAPLRIEADLHERLVGELQGKSNEESGGLWTETVRRWKEGELDFAPPGAESYLTLQGRVVPVLERLARDYADQTLVVVAHGHVCRTLLLSLLPGMSVAAWDRLKRIDNVGITELEVSGEKWAMRRFNEIPAAVERVNGVEG
jgi:2,3-bisphosphoglycerate-dependent phosphoglycerate mutase